jgi:hypothetical protein
MTEARSEEPAARGLIGRPAEVVFSDPWEFAGPDGTTRFSATIAALEAMADGAERDGVIVKLDEGLTVLNQVVAWLLVRARRGPGLLQELSLGEVIEATFVVASSGLTMEGGLFDEADWRGDLAAIGTVELR